MIRIATESIIESTYIHSMESTCKNSSHFTKGPPSALAGHDWERVDHEQRDKHQPNHGPRPGFNRALHSAFEGEPKGKAEGR